VAAQHHQDAEGEETAGEVVGQGSFLLDGSGGEQTLEGSERLREDIPEE
jgi:predicted exporter